MPRGKLCPFREREFIIYRATNTINGKSYIGATCETLRQRRYEHELDARVGRARCRVFAAALRKYGKDAFSWDVLSIHIGHPVAMEAEKAAIATFKPAYNMTIGGRGVIGLQRTPEWRAKMSAAQRGRKISPEQIEKMKRGRAALKTGYRPVVCLDDGLWFENVTAAAAHYSIGHSNIVSSCSGREVTASGKMFAYAESPLSEALRAELMAQRTARLKRRHEKSIAARARPVICTTDGKRYATGIAAARAYDLSQMTIVQCCKDGARTMDGLRFRYEDAPARDKHNKTKAELAAIRARQNAGLAKSWQQTQKRVICVDDGRQFDSITHAARAIGKHVSLLSAAIHRKGRCGGLTFRFVKGEQC